MPRAPHRSGTSRRRTIPARKSSTRLPSAPRRRCLSSRRPAARPWRSARRRRRRAVARCHARGVRSHVRRLQEAHELCRRHRHGDDARRARGSRRQVLEHHRRCRSRPAAVAGRQVARGRQRSRRLGSHLRDAGRPAARRCRSRKASSKRGVRPGRRTARSSRSMRTRPTARAPAISAWRRSAAIPASRDDRDDHERPRHEHRARSGRPTERGSSTSTPIRRTPPTSFDRGEGRRDAEAPDRLDAGRHRQVAIRGAGVRALSRSRRSAGAWLAVRAEGSRSNRASIRRSSGFTATA